MKIDTSPEALAALREELRNPSHWNQAELNCERAADVIEKLEIDARRYRWLRDTFSVAKGGALVSFNEELTVYETPEPGTEVRLTWYPHTPAGHYSIEASTLDAAIDAALAEVNPAMTAAIDEVTR